MSGGIDDHLEVLRLHVHQRRGAGIDEQAPYKVDIAIDRVIAEVLALRIKDWARTLDCPRPFGVASAEIERLREIEKAAINLCDVRGRHHSELAMTKLMEVCGRAKK